MRLDSVEQAGNLCAARIGDQRNPVPARNQLSGERVRGDHVSAGASRSEHEVFADAHRAFHFTT